MKIRLSGSADLVRAWAQAMRDAFGVQGREYPSRYGQNELRVYIDVDDRDAERIVQQAGGAPEPTAADKVVAIRRPRRRRT